LCGFGGIFNALAIPRSKRSSAPGSSLGGLSVMAEKIPDARSEDDEALFYGYDGFGPSPQWREYHVRLGAFMHAFTKAELYITQQIADLTVLALRPRAVPNIDTNYVLAASYIGLRAQPGREALKRLLRNLRKPQATLDAINGPLSHLGEIQALRDMLTHRPVHTYEGGLYVDHTLTAREAKQEEAAFFTVQLLDDATADMLRIPRMIYYLVRELEYPKDQREALTAPWRYKPSALDRRGRTRPHSAQ
jgi:hypothetical protein